jgi:hypothetical protein
MRAPRDNRPKATTAGANNEAQQVLVHWNNNARGIESFVCEHVDIDGKSEGQLYTLNAKLAFQRPSRFRMIGRFAGKSEADLGSNEEEIWFWIARAKPPALYYCKRADLDKVQLATPFQPDWLIEAVGVAPIDPNQFRQVQFANRDFLGIVAHDRGPNGQAVTKRVVFQRGSGRVAAYELFDANHQRIAVAHIDGYFDDPATGLFLPRDVNLEWPQAATSLQIRLSPRRLKINSVTAQQAASLFRRYAGDVTNVEEINLAQLNGRGARAAVVPNTNPIASAAPLETQVQPARGAELTGQIETNSDQGRERLSR